MCGFFLTQREHTLYFTNNSSPIFPIKTLSVGSRQDTFLPGGEIIVEQGGHNLWFFSQLFCEMV